MPLGGDSLPAPPELSSPLLPSVFGGFLAEALGHWKREELGQDVSFLPVCLGHLPGCLHTAHSSALPSVEFPWLWVSNLASGSGPEENLSGVRRKNGTKGHYDPRMDALCVCRLHPGRVRFPPPNL